MKRLILFAAALCLFTSTSISQPVLSFKRIVNNWPTIELYLSVACDGSPRYDMSKEHFAIHENGKAIEDFTLWCPNPLVRCAVSVVFGVEAASLMHRDYFAGLVQAYTGNLDGIIDECGLVWHDSMIPKEAGITPMGSIIVSQARRIPLAASSRYRDLAYATIEKLIREGNNPCRGVLLFSDGVDSISQHSVDDVVALANKNRIRVFTLSAGGQANESELETIALFTGGKHYPDPGIAQMQSIYEEMSTIIFHGFMECLITYQAECMNGELRTVDLTLQNYCNGADTKTKTYRSPSDATTFADMTVGFESGDQGTAGGFILPFSLTSPVDGGERIEGFSLDIEYDTQQYEITAVTVPSATLLLNGNGLTYSPETNGIHIDYTGGMRTDVMGTMFHAHVTKKSPSAPDLFSYTIDDAVVHNACLRVESRADQSQLQDQLQLAVVALDALEQCSPNTVRLHANGGFSAYKWSTGDSAQTIEVSQSGDYWVEATRENGGVLTSPVLHVVIHDPTIPNIVVEGNPIRCYGDSVRLSVDAAYPAYEWSNGQKTPEVFIRKSGMYRVTITNSIGCTYTSLPVEIHIEPSITPDIAGKDTSCVSGYQYYSCGFTSENAQYEWRVEGGSIIDGAGTASIYVQWAGGNTGKVFLDVAHQTCEYHDSLEIALIAPSTPAIDVYGPRIVCNGREAILSTSQPFAYYLWSTGERTQSISVSKPGIYLVEAGASQQCMALSDTVVIDAAPAVPKPVITRHRDTLFSITGYSYVWMRNGIPIPGANEYFYIPVQPGKYSVIISNAWGCIEESDEYNMTIIGIANPATPEAFALRVYPTVTSGVINAVLTGWDARPVHITVTDILGRTVYNTSVDPEALHAPLQMDLSAYPKGMYYVRAVSGSHSAFTGVLLR